MSTATSSVESSNFIDKFPKVTIDETKDNAINTSEFLDAAQSLTTLFDHLGSVAFAPVKADISGNIKKIQDRQKETPNDSTTLQDLVRKEREAKKSKATEGLLWLNRALDFTHQSMQHNLSNPDAELSASFRDGYSKTLKQYHNFLVKPIFMAAMSAMPYRATFYDNLGQWSGLAGQDVLKSHLEVFLKALERMVGILNEFLGRKENKF